MFIGALTSLTELVITDFKPAGDRAYYAGFTKSNLGTIWLQEISIIKEDGEWRFYGNQRDPPPND